MKGYSRQWRTWSSFIGYSVVAGFLVLSLVAMPQAASASEAYVGCPGEPNNYRTIQAAIDDQLKISGSREIKICAGTYHENLTIERGRASELRLIGEGRGKTIIADASAKPTTPSAPIIYVKDTTVAVVIEEVTVDGRSTQGGKVAWGIRYEKSSGTIDDVEVLNIGRCPAEGLGISVEGNQSTEKGTGFAYTVAVRYSEVRNATRVGLLGFGPSMRLEAHNNTIVGPSQPRCFATSGIQVSNQAQGLIYDNDVQDNNSPNRPQGEGSGIIARCAAEESHITDNDVQDSGNGIVVADSSNILVEGNLVSRANVAYSLQVLGSFFGDPKCFESNLKETNQKSSGGVPATAHNVFRGNEGRDSTDIGLALISFDLQTGVPERNTIESNELRNSRNDGIVEFDGNNNTFRNNQCDGSSFPAGLCR